MNHAIVTGAGGGIGSTIARTLAAGGYRVGIFDMDAGRAEAVATEIGNAVAVQCDVTDDASVEKALEAYGIVPDLLVNNAGIVKFTPFLDVPTEDFRKVMDVNVNGAFIMSRNVARGMAKRGSGAVVSITSIGGITTSPGTHAYASSKAGLAALTQLMALELGPMGIRVNCVAPGFIDAGMFSVTDDARARRAGAVPLKRMGTPQDVANAVLFLASDAASYINGHQLVVDGAVSQSVLAQLPRG
jgi:NAD(P)-dependent dehydrogenase (short-subunit alcohol dehydrogenase family)